MEQHFLVFKEVAETKNITLSAKKLHMSQPSISLQIQNLENQYGARFFDRTNKGVTLTKEGQIFYAHVRSVLDLLSNAKEQISALAKDQRGLIYLGATLTIGEYILPNILAFLYKTHPDVDFKVKIANTESISQDVLEKKIHIGLIEGPVPRHKDLNVESFWEDELVVVIPYFHPWASRNSITLAELPHERLVTREDGSGTRKVMEMALKERGLDPEQLNVTMELGSTQAIKQLVSAGLGITIISSLTVSRECDQKIFKILKIQDSPIYRPLSILTNARTTQTKDERLLINLLHDHRLLTDVLSKDYSDSEDF
ncbi:MULTISPECIES: LysR family transcriptional regulator [unclassified Desulfosporosinus]|uniref:LysR family transcriptional regulator n=1 Tax=unclassified Desulfosporosinus TaxID=2633794 RepID=UPI000223B26E|nr:MULTISPECIES: LysR family transcriptional regulator [unclassified Desulfosporosinus]EGW38011.1 bacterial regulatory helix-turn-helix, lysR family protein [Desulfosporosinus sp. OT]ODA42818.1 LysR family transcriptional regulator YeiE [Desulfosporosinus sp. BG]